MNPRLTLAFSSTPSLCKKVRQVAGEGLEELLQHHKATVENSSANKAEPVSFISHCCSSANRK